MAMIDTSFYKQGPTAAQGLASLVGGLKSIKQSKLDDLIMRQAQFEFDEMQRKAKQAEQYRSALGQLSDRSSLSANDVDYLSPEQMQSEHMRLYAQYNPEQYAQMQMRQSDPYAYEKLMLRQQQNELRAKELGVKQSAEERRNKFMPLEFKLKQKNIDSMISKRQFDEASKLKDQEIAMMNHNRAIENEEWERYWKTNKSPIEYAQKQEQLLGQVPKIVREKYLGRAENGGKDLTPENVTFLTDGTEGASKILRNTDELLSLMESYGLEKLPGTAREKMKTLIGNIGLQYKSKEFANLGVLTGPDLEILLSVTGDPTSFTALSSDVQKEKLLQFRKGLIEGYNKGLIVRGFNPVIGSELSSIGTSSANSALDRLKKRKGIK